MIKSNSISTLQINKKGAVKGATPVPTGCTVNMVDPANYKPLAAPDPAKCYDLAVFTAKSSIQELFPNAPAQSIDGGALMQFSVTDGDLTDSGTGSLILGTGDYVGIQVNNSKIGGIWLSSYWNGTNTLQVPLAGPVKSSDPKPDVIVQ